MEHLGFYVCVNDLEDELIRAVGTAGVETLFDSQGELRSYRSLQSQPAWRGREPEAQMRRFLSSGSRRKLRYARLLVEAAVGRDTSPCWSSAARPGANPSRITSRAKGARRRAFADLVLLGSSHYCARREGRAKLTAASDPKLGKDAVQVCADRPVRQIQPLSDVSV